MYCTILHPQILAQLRSSVLSPTVASMCEQASLLPFARAERNNTGIIRITVYFVLGAPPARVARPPLDVRSHVELPERLY
jgi:hypothetical protein